MNITYPRQVCQAIKDIVSLYCNPVYYQMKYIDNIHLQNGKSYMILKLYKLTRTAKNEKKIYPKYNKIKRSLNTGSFKIRVSMYYTSFVCYLITSQCIDVT